MNNIRSARSLLRPALLALIFLGHLQGRTFTDANGRQVEAELVGIRGDNVILERNGRLGQWPISQLSVPDQAYVKVWRQNPPVTARVSVRIWEREGVGPNGIMNADAGGLPKDIPLIRSTETKSSFTHYEADLTAPNDRDASKLTVGYILYLVNAANQVEAHYGSQFVETIPAGKRVTVATEGVSLDRTKTTQLTVGSTVLGGISLGSDSSRAKERFAGAWVRAFAPDGTMVGESRSLIPELERQDPAWSAPQSLTTPPLLDALNALGDILKKLPPPPEPPADLPKPPGLPFP
ncbi:MAG: hypothetical protein AAGJ31_04130 [Verrucomicrobiota bacterium]